MRALSNLGLLSGMIRAAAINIMPTPFVPLRTGRPMIRGGYRNRTTYFPAGLNGKKAIARRLRQIQAGSLKAENGLVTEEILRKVNAPDRVEAV